MDELQRMSEKNPLSSGICLHTENRNNVILYEHLNFRIVSEAEIEEIITWCMFRPNNSSKP
jgi:hypothetical protein